jgi:uncharacterized protein
MEEHHFPLPLLGSGPMIVFDEKLKKILKEVKLGVESLVENRPVKIFLYGSMARGDYEKDSDIDLAIIVSDLTRDLKNKIFETVGELEIDHLTPLSVLVFSEEDFLKLKSLERRIALDIEREGIQL